MHGAAYLGPRGSLVLWRSGSRGIGSSSRGGGRRFWLRGNLVFRLAAGFAVPPIPCLLPVPAASSTAIVAIRGAAIAPVPLRFPFLVFPTIPVSVPIPRTRSIPFSSAAAVPGAVPLA